MITRGVLKTLKERYGFLSRDANYDFNYNVYFCGELILCRGLN